jgi:hypothetical protein
MKKEYIGSLQEGDATEPDICGYRFGSGEKAACVIGSLSGEIQQRYICSQLVKTLKELEEKGAIVSRNEILVIPSLNRNCMKDPSFELLKDYPFIIQFPDAEQKGDFVPHVCLEKAGLQNISLANLFGLPYAIVKKSSSMEDALAAYGHPAMEGSVFSIYTTSMNRIDEAQARQAVSSVLRFLTRMGMLRYTSHSGYIASVLREDDLAVVKADQQGICRPCVNPGDEVSRGQQLALITDPLEGDIVSRILSPTDGIIFYVSGAPVAQKDEVLFQIVRRLHR